MAFNKTFLGSAHRTNPEQFEAAASVAITAGHLCVQAGGELKPHDVAGAGGFVYVAKEPILGEVDYEYAIGETAFTYVPGSKELYQMRLAASQTILVDSALASNGDGTLKLSNGTTDETICYADEALTTGVGVTSLIKVKFK